MQYLPSSVDATMAVVRIMKEEPSEIFPRLKHPVRPMERKLRHYFVSVWVEDYDFVQTGSFLLHLVKDLTAKEEE